MSRTLWVVVGLIGGLALIAYGGTAAPPAQGPPASDTMNQSSQFRSDAEAQDRYDSTTEAQMNSYMYLGGSKYLSTGNKGALSYKRSERISAPHEAAPAPAPAPSAFVDESAKDEEKSMYVGEKPATFSTALSCRNLTTPVPSQATGNATFRLSEDGKTLHYTLDVMNIKDANGAHLHWAKAGRDGPPVVALFTDTRKGAFTGTLVEGDITANDLTGPLKGKDVSALVSEIRSGNVYLNVHTAANPNGEIRGQLSAASISPSINDEPMKDEPIKDEPRKDEPAVHESPAVEETPARSEFRSEQSSQDRYHESTGATIDRYTGPVGGSKYISAGNRGLFSYKKSHRIGGGTDSMVYGGEKSLFHSESKATVEEKDSYKDESCPPAEPAKDEFRGETPCDAPAEALPNETGKSEFVGEEMTGKRAFVATLSGKDMPTAIETTATATALFWLSDDGKTLHYRLNVRELENPQAAYVHWGPKGQDLKPVVELTRERKEGTFSGNWAKGEITDDDLMGPLEDKTVDDLLTGVRNGEVFVMIGTTEKPEGIIRGKLMARQPTTRPIDRSEFKDETMPPSKIHPTGVDVDVEKAPALTDEEKSFFEGETDTKNMFIARLSATDLPKAGGTVWFRVSDDGKTLHYRINLREIDSPTGAYLHWAAEGKDPQAVVELTKDDKEGMFSGKYAEGDINADDLMGPLEGKELSALVEGIRNGEVTIKVGTTDKPEGVLMGEVMPHPQVKGEVPKTPPVRDLPDYD